MAETDTPINGQEILVQIHSGDVPSNWSVLHTSRKKLTILIWSFCSCIGLIIGISAIYLLINSSRFPPIPPNALQAILIITLALILGTILLAIATWVTTKNVVLVLMPEGFVYGDSKKPKTIVCIQYQYVAKLDATGGFARIELNNKWKTKFIDCRLLESPANEVAFNLKAAYGRFKTHNK